MIKVWILVLAYYSSGVINPIPPMADLASCERVKSTLQSNTLRDGAKCVEVNIPVPSDYAWHWQGKSK